MKINDFTNDNLIEKNVLYYIDSRKEGNTIIQFAACNNKILKYSNEWLYLITDYFNPNNLNSVYQRILNYQYIIFKKNIDQEINKKVIPFITSFSNGTVHGYSGLYYILLQYINNYEKYKEYYIIVYENSQKGILDIINNAIEKNFINKKKVIFISDNTLYLFDEIYIIPNMEHNIFSSSKLKINVNNYISKNLISECYNNNYGEKIALLKLSNSENNTNSGIISNYDAKLLAINYKILDLNIINNEIELINIIYNCTEFLTSWGTSLMKNFVYISDKCKKITVIVKGVDFINQYNLIKNKEHTLKFKNANIEYIIIN